MPINNDEKIVEIMKNSVNKQIGNNNKTRDELERALQGGKEETK